MRERAKKVDGVVLERLVKVLASEPDISNVALAERFGLRAHTVGRIRKTLAARAKEVDAPRESV